MCHRKLARLFLTIAAPLAACAQGEGSPGGAAFEIAVAPITIDGVTNACYRLTVTNAPDRAGEIVWQEPSICADDYGDGLAAITYVGTCDASDTIANSVTIELLDLYSGATPAPIDDDEYVNPCATVAGWSDLADRSDITGEDAEDQNGPCTINRLCQENTDVRVEFNLTIIRDAHQGFFDIAVEFEDVFCSAKLDCHPAFLHDGDGDRNATAIVAFACTSGENEETYLHVSDLQLSCNGGAQIIPIDATATPGQYGPQGASPQGVFQSAVYVGNEQLTSNGQPLEKCYWNRAIGLDLANLTPDCVLSGIASATASATMPDFTADGVSYPAVTWSVPVLTANGLCTERQLNVDGSGVATTYLSNDLPAAQLTAAVTGFQTGATFDCAAGQPIGPGGPTPVSCQVGPSGASTASVTEASGVLTVTMGSASTTVTLPAGVTLGTSCQVGNCCNGND